MVYNTEVRIYMKTKYYKFYYSYNKDTLFIDLLEYISFLFPELEICQCFEFQGNNNYYDYYNYKKQYIGNKYKISTYSNYLSNLELIDKKKEKYCPHKDNYLKYSKTKLISIFQKEINELKNYNNNKNKEIENLNREKEEKEKTIYSLNIEKNEQEKKINNLNREKEEKEKTINSLNIKKNDQEKKINNLNREKDLLEYAINGDVDKIDLLNKLGVKGVNLKKKDNLIQIDDNSNEIKGNQKNIKENFIDFYDVIVHIDSIKDINKGWKIEYNNNAKGYESYKNQKLIKIGIIGNLNKGKSFILSKLSKINLPSGTSIRTEGLSIKYPDLELFNNRRIALLDSAGLETPVLNLNNQNNIPDDKINELFREKSREKLITELFLQNYIINNSSILIAVVGILTYSEQKLLMKIKKEMERTKIKIPLFIIHNLITYTSVEQVENYINDFLLNSATFKLEIGHNISTKIGIISGKYFYETKQGQKIYHLIFANEGSEAGKNYNQFTLDFIEGHYKTVVDEEFDVIETIKDTFLKLSKDIIEEIKEKDKDPNVNNANQEKTHEQITKINFDDSNSEYIKLKDINEIILKKCLTDELGFSNLKANGFEPTYNLFKKENKIIIRLELPGNIKNLVSDIKIEGPYNIIKIKGEKRKDKEPKNEKDNIFNTREYGSFTLEIPLKTEDYLLSNKEPNNIEKKGLYFIEYELLTKNTQKVIPINEDDEI